MVTRSLISVTALAMVSGLAVPSSGVLPSGEHDMRNASQGWYEETAPESLRRDQCLMTEVLRMGGPSMSGVAQDALNQQPDALHTLADPDYWNGTPLSEAFSKDQDTADSALQGLYAKVDEWKEPLAGLQTPGGFSDAGFHWPPGTSDGKKNFYEQTGLSKWVSARFWQDQDSFYEDPTPQADTTVRQAVTSQGDPLYADEADPSLPPAEWNRAYDEHQAYDYLLNWSLEPTGADNARIFLTYGGFPRTGPQQGTLAYRIAVENMKTRFATCAWRDPIDPDDALSDVVATAASEWQSEVASQAVQRNQILDANATATKALASGAETLGDMLGNSWAADHLVRWQAYWSPGGPGDDEAFPPSEADFDQAEQELSDARSKVAEELSDLRAQSDKAEQAAETTDQAQQAAYEIADASGAPRGRGLLVGQQKAQVTSASAAALDAMVAAGETAKAATRASSEDSKTIADRARAQAAETKAAFRTAAAQKANAQAKAAADGAAEQADKAEAANQTAHSKLSEAKQDEADAKAAAATAHAKRLAAEQESDTAKAEKETAAAKEAEADQHRQNAEADAATAQEAEAKAQSAAETAHSKRQAAEDAADKAKAKRDAAWDAESKAKAGRAKAPGKGGLRAGARRRLQRTGCPSSGRHC